MKLELWTVRTQNYWKQYNDGKAYSYADFQDLHRKQEKILNHKTRNLMKLVHEEQIEN